MIVLGHRIQKPVETQEQCNAYAQAATAVNDHNAGCRPGETLWTIADKSDCYEVVEDGLMPEPAPAAPTVAEQLAEMERKNELLTQCMLEISEIVYA